MANNFKNFDYTYGVGMEFKATSAKQVKDVLKVNLDSLSKMVRDYNKVLKIDPNADMSKLFEEMRKLKGVVDGINDSDNSFASFVDKGTLTRIEALETDLKGIDAVSKEVKADLKGLKDTVVSLLEPLKASGQIKFPATFDNLFGDIKDQSAKIKDVTDQIDKLNISIKNLQNSKSAFQGSTDTELDPMTSTSQVKAWISEFKELQKQLSGSTLEKLNIQELEATIFKLSNLGQKLNAALSTFGEEDMAGIGFSLDGKDGKALNDFLLSIPKKIDFAITQIQTKRSELSEQLEQLRTEQTKYNAKNAMISSSNKRSIGVQSEYNAQVKVTPKTNETEWADKINDTITNIEPQLKRVKLTPTFSKGKDVEKELEGNIAQINHTIGVDFKVANFNEFTNKIKNIDHSIDNALRAIKEKTNFKFRFEFEEGKQFKDGAYAMINKFKEDFKRFETTFKITNGSAFTKAVQTLRDKAAKKMKDIAVKLSLKHENLLGNIDSLRTEIDKKISNIGIKLYIENAPALTSQIDAVKDQIGSIAGNNIVTPSVTSPADGLENLSEAAKNATEDLEKCKAILQELTKYGFNSKAFLKLGDISQDGKKKRGSTEQLTSMVEEYQNLQRKLSQNEDLNDWFQSYPEAKGNQKSLFGLVRKDQERLKQLERDLNLYLQKQIIYTQSRKDAAEAILRTEGKIADTQKNKSNKSDDTSKDIKNNQQLAMSAEEAAKKIRSLNTTLAHQRKDLQDLNSSNGWKNSSAFIKLGEWDKETQSFKKNSKYIQELVDKYNKLRDARIKSGGANTTVTGEEAKIRGQLSAIYRQQKQHLAEIIAKNEEELALVKSIKEAYQNAGNESVIDASTKNIEQLTAKLNKAKETLTLLNSKKFDALSLTGLGDINKTLGDNGFNDLIAKYNKLIAKRSEFEKAGTNVATNPEYVALAKEYQAIEQQLKDIYKDQWQYTESRIEQYEKEIAQAKLLLSIITQQTEEERQQINQNDVNNNAASPKQTSSTSSTSNIVQIDSATLNLLAKDASLNNIDGKVGKILERLGQGINITGSNISISANNVDINGSVANANTQQAQAPKEQSQETTKQANINQNISVTAEEATKEQKELNHELKETKRLADSAHSSTTTVVDELTKEIKEITDVYKSPDKVVEVTETSKWVSHGKDEPKTFEHTSTVYKTNMEAFNKLYQTFIKALAKQKQIEYEIQNSDGPTSKLQAELAIQKEIADTLEAQLKYHEELYTLEAQQEAQAQALNKAQMEIAKSVGAQSDKNINKQNAEIIKIVNNAQKKLNDMQYSMNNFQIPMAEPITAKFKEYEQLLATLQRKQREIINQPELLDNANYSENFTLLLQQMKKAEEEFATLYKSSESFLNKIRSIEDIKILDKTFNATNLEQMHDAMQEFANQTGVGVAKLVEFNDVERTATFEIKNGKGQVQQLVVAYDSATNSLGRFTSQTRDSVSETKKFFNSLKHSFQNVARYVASFGSVYRLFAIIKQGVTYVKEIDSALTELKKVTDETDASYDRFLQTMSKTASKVGSTVKDLTTMAAEWSRLGYSMEESGKLAESTAVLLNVSEFEDATKASEALISTMQAFQYTADESRHVVDILNEIGNNYAISSDGIATALQDSASALMEGGNNLEQATALVAAANKVVYFVPRLIVI